MVNLYLVRHGQAKPKEQDPERPLTEAGAEWARRVFAFIGRADVISVGAIQHSTKLRARQTAEIFAAAANLNAPLTQVPNLEPLDDVTELAESLSRATMDLMLVGHLPHLNRLASQLVVGDARLEAFAFPECGVLCLRRSEGAGEETGGAAWRVSWMLDPRLLAW